MKRPHFILFMALLVVLGCTNNIRNDTKWGSDRCAIHKTEMKKATVRIIYGEWSPPDEHARTRMHAMDIEFPNAKTWITGGCIVNDDSPMYALVYVCDGCFSTAREWDSAH